METNTVSVLYMETWVESYMSVDVMGARLAILSLRHPQTSL